MSTPQGGTNANKDVIYIDVDDEITGIIDKVTASDKKIVALVLPKRAAVLQSIVNMKLLKRAAESEKKNIVLITSEAGLLPLAGSVGIHISRSLNSKPEVPAAPERTDDVDSVEEVADDADGEPVDQTKTVGELSGAAADDDDIIELGDEDEDAADATAGKPGKLKGKKFSIPNFNKFRVLLILGVLGVVLLGGFGYAALAVIPKAKVIIKTDSTALDTNANLTLKTGADVTLDVEQSILPAQIQEVKKTLTQEVPATGQINNGEKAEGSVVMTVKDCTPPFSTPTEVPSGSGITTGGNTYITQKKATFHLDGADDCVYYTTNAIEIIAQNSGAKFNVASATFAVRSGVTANGSASGGTDEITKVVTKADIDSATQKIGAQETAPVQQELKTALIGRDLFVVDATFGIGAPETKASVGVNAPAETVTVTQTINYTMLGVKQDDLKKIIDKNIAKEIDIKKQSVTSYGLDKATFSLQSANADGATVAMQTTVVTGAELNIAVIKQQIAGKKASDAKELIMENPGVTDVTVVYSPFWVSAIPKKVDKITVTVQEPEVKTKDATAAP